MDGCLLDLSQIEPFQKWALVCVAALTILYAVMRPWKKRRNPSARPIGFSPAAQREIEKQMTELIVELEGMARQMTAQLDTRSAKLEMLIKEADSRIAALERGNATPPSPANSAETPAQSVIPDSRYMQIYDLAEQGHSPRQIARQLSRQDGEIELILALKARESAPSSVAS